MMDLLNPQVKEIPWIIIHQRCKELLSTKQSNMVHETSVAELKLFLAAAEDRLQCAAMSAALSKGGACGQPGMLDLTAIDVELISSVVDEATTDGTRTTAAAEMLNACKDIKTVRLALGRTQDPNHKTSSEAWEAIKRIVEVRMDEAPKKEANLDAGWALCKNEMLLLAQDAHLASVRSFLSASITKALKVYAVRNSYSLSQRGDSAISVPRLEETELDLSSLETCLEYSHCLHFESVTLQQFMKI